MKKLLLAFLLLISFTTVMAQNYWSAHISTARIAMDRAVARKSFPTNFKLFDLNISPLRKELFNVVDNKLRHKVIIVIPNAKGELEEVSLYQVLTVISCVFNKVG